MAAIMAETRLPSRAIRTMMRGIGVKLYFLISIRAVRRWKHSWPWDYRAGKKKKKIYAALLSVERKWGSCYIGYFPVFRR